MEVTFKNDQKVEDLLGATRLGWGEGEKIEYFCESFLKWSEVNTKTWPISSLEVELKVLTGNQRYDLEAWVKGGKIYSRGFCQTTVESFTFGGSINKDNILHSLLSEKSAVGIEWKSVLKVKKGYKGWFDHNLQPGQVLNVGIVENTWNNTCPPIEKGEGWTYSFLPNSETHNSTYIHWPPEGWSLTLKSIADIEEEEANNKEEKLNSSIESAQKYLGWSIKTISQRRIVVENPQTKEEVIITSHHGVWDYGECSEDWLTIGTNRI